MPLLYQNVNFSVIVFMLCIMAAVMQRQPVKIPTLSIPNIFGQCLSYDNRQVLHDFLLNASRQIVYPLFSGCLQPECGSGNWRRVFYLNISASDQSCPGDWNLVTSPVRGCAGAGSSCRSAFSDDVFAAYGKVCGRVIGESAHSPDAFYRFKSNQNTIEGNYLEGVSVTHGAPGSRTHIWTLGTGHRNRCPCDNSNRTIAPLPPAEVGDNYFCGRANELNHLWTGANCMNDNPCCSFHNPPYFNVQLPVATTDEIEIRICSDQSHGNEPVLVLFAEIYVQ